MNAYTLRNDSAAGGNGGNLVTRLCDDLLGNEDQDITTDMIETVFTWFYDFGPPDENGQLNIVAVADIATWPHRELFLHTHITDWLRDAAALANEPIDAKLVGGPYDYEQVDRDLKANFLQQLVDMVNDNEDEYQVTLQLQIDLRNIHRMTAAHDCDPEDLLIAATELAKNNRLLNFLLTQEI